MAADESGGIALRERTDASVVEVWGEIDVAMRSQAGAALATLLQRDLPVVVDMSGVTFMDSTGIAFLVQLASIGRAEGLAVTMVDPPAAVAEVLDIIGIAEIFDREPAAV
ncbi:anti-anti-sigma factor [Sediminihabitans luteus]|uniref:Anti-sigma factor antagonist n=1 Tax=Sediminihabitans luteus TaxID=1138585 RepID=A0A2M9CQ83_9CELL|nr:STAS domain-containing protein [Sediminihabitans luteus]PJJ73998.1 anti-anti-sigma factor [Sediminihabitans luteus]GII98088.1 anti-sigma factor antagonist [Sediminihabitans luteus]